MKKIICIALIFIISTSSIIFAATTTANISVVPNQATISVDGKLISADNFLYNGTTYVPLRAISENLLCNVSWDQQTKTATITSKSNLSTQNDTISNDSAVYDTMTIINDYEILKENIEAIKEYSESAYSAYSSGNITDKKISDLEKHLSIAQDTIKSNNTNFLFSTEKTQTFYNNLVPLIYISVKNLEIYKNSNRNQDAANLASKTESESLRISNAMLIEHINPDLKTAINAGLILSKYNK